MTLARLVAQLAEQQPAQADAGDRPYAAVALLLLADPDRLLLIRRAERAGDPWSGHLALPGGRRSRGDADLLATAIRETEEETGVRLERAWCFAQLDDLVPRTTLPPIVVRPFVFVLPVEPPVGISDEVAHASWLPLAQLAADGVLTSRVLTIRGEPHEVRGYQLSEGFLWGMTERIVTPVVERWGEISRRTG